MTPKVSTATIIRTALLILALTNQLLAAFGYSPLPINSVQLELFISSVATTAVALWTWWKDNDFTKKARLNKAK